MMGAIDDLIPKFDGLSFTLCITWRCHPPFTQAMPMTRKVLTRAALALLGLDAAYAFTSQSSQVLSKPPIPVRSATATSAPRLYMAPDNKYSPFSGPKSKALTYDITTVNSPQGLLDFLAEDDRLCVVKVHANWCRICKKFDLQWRKLISSEGDKLDASGNLSVPGRIRFAEIEYTVNEDLVRRLEATRMPHVIFYAGQKGLAGKLTHFQCGPSAFGLVVDSCNYFMGQYPANLPPPFDEMVAYQKGMAEEELAREELAREELAKEMAQVGGDADGAKEAEEPSWRDIQAQLDREKAATMAKEENLLVNSASGQAQLDREKATAMAQQEDLLVRSAREVFQRSLLTARITQESRTSEMWKRAQEETFQRSLLKARLDAERKELEEAPAPQSESLPDNSTHHDDTASVMSPMTRRVASVDADAEALNALVKKSLRQWRLSRAAQILLRQSGLDRSDQERQRARAAVIARKTQSMTDLKVETRRVDASSS